MVDARLIFLTLGVGQTLDGKTLDAWISRMLHGAETDGTPVHGPALGLFATDAFSIAHADAFGNAVDVDAFGRGWAVGISFGTLAVWHAVDLSVDDIFVVFSGTATVEAARSIDARCIFAARRTPAFVHVFTESFEIEQESLVALASDLMVLHLAHSVRSTGIASGKAGIFTTEVVALFRLCAVGIQSTFNQITANVSIAGISSVIGWAFTKWSVISGGTNGILAAGRLQTGIDAHGMTALVREALSSRCTLGIGQAPVGLTAAFVRISAFSIRALATVASRQIDAHGSHVTRRVLAFVGIDTSACR